MNRSGDIEQAPEKIYSEEAENQSAPDDNVAEFGSYPQSEIADEELSDQEKTDNPEILKIEISSPPQKTDYFKGETLDTAGLVLKAIYKDGTTETIEEGFVCFPEKLDTAGTQAITVSYKEETTVYTVTVKNVSVSAVKIKSLPSKTVYFSGDMLDTSGLTLTATYNNGKVKTITSGFKCSPEELSKTGKQAITVTYGGKSASFDVTVKKIAVSEVKINSMPEKTTYLVGELLNTSGLTLTATYNNGKTKTVSSGFTCNPMTLASSGTQRITVSYGNYTTEFNVTVRNDAVSEISINTKPDTLTYYIGDKLNTTGLSLSVKYLSGKEEIVTGGFKCSPSTFSAEGQRKITVSYGGKQTAFNVTVKQSAISSIKVKTSPNKTTYYVGEEFNKSGLTLTAVYSNGSQKTVSSGFTCSPAKLSKEGTQKITVTYNGQSTSLNVTVKEDTVSSVTIKTKPDKLVYIEGAELNTSGLTLTVKYTHLGTEKTVSSGFKCSPAVLSKIGTQKITVTYGGKTDSFDVTVKENTVKSIAIKAKPRKLRYYLGEEFDPTGMTLTATYLDGSKKTITNGYNYSPKTITKTGTNIIVISYGGATVNLGVGEIGISYISSINGIKKFYNVGDSFKDGLSVTVKYSDGTTATIKDNFDTAPSKATKEGSQVVTVSVSGKTAKFTAEVIDPVVSIKVIKLPYRTEYYQGEKLDTSGLELRVKYYSGKTEDVTKGFSCSPTNLGYSTGRKTITVEYGNKTTSFTAEVLPDGVEGIGRIVTMPNKTEYYVGETFDITGLSVTAVYRSGKEEVVKSGFTDPKTKFTTTGRKTVTVRYEGLPIPITVNVKE